VLILQANRGTAAVIYVVEIVQYKTKCIFFLKDIVFSFFSMKFSHSGCFAVCFEIMSTLQYGILKAQVFMIIHLL